MQPIRSAYVEEQYIPRAFLSPHTDHIAEAHRPKVLSLEVRKRQMLYKAMF